jgi:UDP-N-acetylglucosamine 2-epimerase (non-hydrolysing)
MVQGDTSSALGAALAGSMAGVPVAHVEAGLRTHDTRFPWPEEEYRVAIDAHADLLFAPTELAAANLRAENVPGQIFVTGNTGIDATLEAERRLPPASMRDGGLPKLLVTCHRRESWGAGMESIAGAVAELATLAEAQIDFMLHPNGFVRSKMVQLLGGTAGINLIEPCDPDEMLDRMRNSDLILSDSGGIQEEAPVLGVPLLVLREKTERPEGIASGNSKLVGTDHSRIVTEARRLLNDPWARAAMSRRAFPFGDGRAGARIAAIVAEWSGRQPVWRLA